VRTEPTAIGGDWRLAAVVRGEIRYDPKFATKYSGLVSSLATHGIDVEPFDATLPLSLRVVDALMAFHPDPVVWRRRLRNNPLAFRLRSARIARKLASRRDRIDAVLQFGAVFDSRWLAGVPPSVIYTDYTARLAADRPLAGRAPARLAHWMRLEKRCYSRARFVCARSEMVRGSLIRHYDVPREKIRVVGGGANLPVLPALPPRDPGSPPTVLFIGRDFERKGGDLVLRAFASVRQRLPQARLLFATRRPIPPGFPTTGVVRVSPDWDRARVLDLYANSDLLVLPARLETWGDVLIEAMSHGLPCVGVRGEPMEEIIDHGATGLLVEPEDVEALSESILRLLTDLELRRNLGGRARHTVERQFTWDHVTHRLIPALAQAVAGTS
jgi:glycosyltransferase involved in cell wall biosynthesis